MVGRNRVVAGLVAASLLLAGVTSCGSDHEQTASAGSLTVFAAASLTESFTDVKAALQASSPGPSIRYSFAGSGALVAQVKQGAPADVIATADTASMRQLTDAGLVEAPSTFARNKLEVLVAHGNPKGVETLADLAAPGLRVVLADDTVPAGKYAARALGAAGVTVHPVSKEPDVKSAVAKVTSGEADATIVYVSDVAAAGARGQGIVIPEEQNVTAEYPIAIVKATRHHSTAAAFVRTVLGQAGQRALVRRGFLPAR